MIMTDGLRTLCMQRIIAMMFIGMDVTPDIVRRNAHRTGNSFFIASNHRGQRHMPSYVSYSSARTSARLRSVVGYHPSQLSLSSSLTKQTAMY